MSGAVRYPWNGFHPFQSGVRLGGFENESFRANFQSSWVEASFLRKREFLNSEGKLRREVYAFRKTPSSERRTQELMARELQLT